MSCPTLLWQTCHVPELVFQVQLTDFENAAYVVFVVLLTRVILSYKLDFLIPLSKVKMSVEGTFWTVPTVSVCPSPVSTPRPLPQADETVEPTFSC